MVLSPEIFWVLGGFQDSSTSKNNEKLGLSSKCGELKNQTQLKNHPVFASLGQICIPGGRQLEEGASAIFPGRCHR
jgi:hypothetical protein